LGPKTNTATNPIIITSGQPKPNIVQNPLKYQLKLLFE
jgi:hypothetical protein